MAQVSERKRASGEHQAASSKEITLSRRRREKLQRRADIIGAAKEIFYSRGFMAATMDDIAAAAELSKGTLYLYFSSKDELYISIILEGFQIIEERLEEIKSSRGDVFEKGRAMFMAFVGFCLENPEYFRVTQYFLNERARRNLSPEVVNEVSGYTSRLLEYVAELVRQGREEGVLRADLDPLVFALIAWRTSTGILDLAIVNDATGLAAEPYVKLLEDAFDLLITGARSGAGSGRAVDS